MSQDENRAAGPKDEPPAGRLGYRILKTALIVLVAAGAIFLWKFAARRQAPDLTPHRAYLQRLEAAYNLRQDRIRADYEEKISGAPNEVLSVKFQQEENQELAKAQDLYFSDKEAVTRGDYRALAAHWGEELKRLPATIR